MTAMKLKRSDEQWVSTVRLKSQDAPHCATIASWCFVSAGSLIVRRPTMDPQTVIAVCELLLVAIGIVGIAELRRR